jgi:hypothetical protein
MKRTVEFAKKVSDQKRTLRKSKSRKNAYVRNEGARPIRQPMPNKALLDWLATLKPLEEDFPEIEDFPPEPCAF